MKPSLFVATLFLLVSALVVTVASAATLYWDTNGATAGAGNPADGTWDVATNTTWTTDSTGSSATTVYTQDSDIVFSAGGDTATANVTVSSADGTPTAASITFKNGATTLSGANFDNGASSYIEYVVHDGASGVVNQSTGSYNANFDVQGTGTLLVNMIWGGSSMAKNGTGTLTVNRLDATLTINAGTVIYTGTVGTKLKNCTINSTGTLRLTGNAFEDKRYCTVNAGGQLELAAGVTEQLAGLNGAGSTSGETGSLLRVGDDNKSSTFSGDISGGLAIMKIGTGTFTASGANSFSGGTSVTSGTVAVSGSGTLGTGDVIVQAAGALTLGGDAENQSISDTASLKLYEDTGDYAIVNLNQNETVGALFFNDIQQTGGTWGATGSGATHINNDYFSGSSILTVIPEPATLSLLAAGAVALIRRRR